MDCADKFCRVCLTSESDCELLPAELDDDVVKKISRIFKIQTGSAGTFICKACSDEVDIAWKVFQKIHDATEYLEMLVEKKPQPESTVRKPPIMRKKVAIRKANTQRRIFIYACEICSKTFSDSKILDEHISTHKEYACFYCNEVFASHSERREHYTATHATPKSSTQTAVTDESELNKRT